MATDGPTSDDATGSGPLDALGVLADTPGLPRLHAVDGTPDDDGPPWIALARFGPAEAAALVERTAAADRVPAAVAASFARYHLADALAVPWVLARVRGLPLTPPRPAGLWLRPTPFGPFSDVAVTAGDEVGAGADVGRTAVLADALVAVLDPVLGAIDAAVPATGADTEDVTARAGTTAGADDSTAWSGVADEIAAIAVADTARRGADVDRTWRLVTELLDALASAGAPLRTRPERDDVGGVGTLVVRSTCCLLLRARGPEGACPSCPRRDPLDRRARFTASVRGRP